jgi:hypothetical protein
MGYLEELKEKLYPQLKDLGYKLLPKGNTLRIVKDMKIVMTLIDRGDYIEMSYEGQSYKYDKWYTKPEHLVPVITGQFQQTKQAKQA